MKQSQSLEFNFDGLVGPTHNYAGLSFGNIASQQNAGSISNPKQAAKQGLLKMRLLMELGIPQAVLAPQQRPNLELLRSLGFSGDTAKLLKSAHKYQPELLNAVYSAASMWTANMATASASANTADKRLHITPANLVHNLHRAQEANFSYQLLKKIFADPKHFAVHAPLAANRDLRDEGAANHSSLCQQYGMSGLEMFVYSNDGSVFPGRQSKLASSSIMRNHLLNEDRCIFLQQNSIAIDAGVFHNDVIWVANKNVALYHSQAFVDWPAAKQKIKDYFAGDFHFLEIEANSLDLTTAVQTYLFNSQLVSLPDSDAMALIAPLECQSSKPVQELLSALLAANNPLKTIKYVDCLQSMRNGGGPACLRLRLVLNPAQQRACHQGAILDQSLYQKLELWIDKHYRDRLSSQDLLDPLLVDEIYTALDELTNLLDLGAIYQFQKC